MDSYSTPVQPGSSPISRWWCHLYLLYLPRIFLPRSPSKRGFTFAFSSLLLKICLIVWRGVGFLLGPFNNRRVSALSLLESCVCYTYAQWPQGEWIDGSFYLARGLTPACSIYGYFLNSCSRGAFRLGSTSFILLAWVPPGSNRTCWARSSFLYLYIYQIAFAVTN